MLPPTPYQSALSSSQPCSSQNNSLPATIIARYTETQLWQTCPGDMVYDSDIDEDTLLKSDLEDCICPTVPVKRKLLQSQNCCRILKRKEQWLGEEIPETVG